MEVAQTVNPATFEMVWATLDKIAKRQEEITASQEELAASQKEADRQMKENREDFNRRLGALTNLFGDVTEAMIAPKLREKFMELGLIFPKANPNASVNDRENNIFLEIDVMLENGDKAMLVEAKTKLTIERVNSHISRLEKMRAYANLHNDKRTFLGAVAGVVVTDEVRKYAINQGFYVIEPSGESFNITPPIGKPKEW
jgi:hypothetical protein